MAGNIDLAGLVPDDLMTQLASHLEAAQKSGSKPEPLPFDFRLDSGARDAANRANSDFGGVRSADAQTKKEVNDIIKELNAEVPRAVPNAQYVFPAASVYVVNDPEINVESYSGLNLKKDSHGRDTNTPSAGALAVTISTGTLHSQDPSLQLTQAELKSVVAHEYAHALITANPELLDDPRFQPRHSKQYDKDVAHLEDLLNHSSLSEQEKQQKRDRFKEEQVADNMALWMTKDSASAKSATYKIDKLHNEIGNRVIDPLEDPHPSVEAREEQREITERRIQAASGPKTQQKQGQTH